ncbi:MAG: sulfotransferase [Alphaproteobacteria bacterium]
MNSCRPTYFVCIGAQKAGTTWLAEYLYAHPEVYLSPYKEMRFFNSKSLLHQSWFNWRLWLRRRNIELTKYGQNNAIGTIEQSRELHRLFLLTCLRSKRAYKRILDYGAKNKKAAGEITPLYTDLDADQFREIDALLPGCRFLLIVRSPVARFISQYSMEKRRGFRPRNRSVMAALRSQNYRRRGDYKRTLEALFEAVPRSRVLVVFFENLFAGATCNGIQMQQIGSFLGIDCMPADSSEAVNRNEQRVELCEREQALVARSFVQTYEYMKTFNGGVLPDSWQRELAVANRYFGMRRADEQLSFAATTGKESVGVFGWAGVGQNAAGGERGAWFRR